MFVASLRLPAGVCLAWHADPFRGLYRPKPHDAPMSSLLNRFDVVLARLSRVIPQVDLPLCASFVQPFCFWGKWNRVVA